MNSTAPSLPLTADEFEALMRPIMIGNSSAIAVAVSGGADSLALTLLLKEWCNTHHHPLFAVSVDHQLRPESSAELDQLRQWLKRYDIELHALTLQWGTKAPTTSLQLKARNARYRAIADFCHQHNIGNVFTAHHKDDQAETFLIRLSKGSGLDGLSAMSAQIPYPNQRPTQQPLQLVRPLLDIPKARLIATLHNYKQDWINDPSNHNDSFTRVKMRNALETEAIDGMTADPIHQSITRLQRVKDYIEQQCEQHYADIVQPASSENSKPSVISALLCDHERFNKLHEEIRSRLLRRMIRDIRNTHQHIKEDKIITCLTHLQRDNFDGMTLGGCSLHSLRGQIIIYRQSGHINSQTEIERDQIILWDGRYLIKSDRAGSIVPLDDIAWSKVKGQNPDHPYHLMPHKSRYSMPVFIPTQSGEVILPNIKEHIKEMPKTNDIYEKTGFLFDFSSQ